MVSPKELHRTLSAALAAADIPDAAFDVQCMMEQVSQKPFQQLMLSDAISETEASELHRMAERRKNGEPLQYILEEWEFYGLRIFVGKGVLIPRPDTETLVDTVLEYAKIRKALRIADLCSGSGCIALALKANLSQASVYAVEKSSVALAYLQKNVRYHGDAVEIRCADVLHHETAAQLRDLDVIVSNPPYLTEQDMEQLQTEVRHEPEMALRGGADGLHFYREMTALWKNSLRNGGMLAYEVGMGQARDVEQILQAHGFTEIQRIPDLAGIERVVRGILSEG